MSALRGWPLKLNKNNKNTRRAQREMNDRTGRRPQVKPDQVARFGVGRILKLSEPGLIGFTGPDPALWGIIIYLAKGAELWSL